MAMRCLQFLVCESTSDTVRPSYQIGRAFGALTTVSMALLLVCMPARAHSVAESIEALRAEIAALHEEQEARIAEIRRSAGQKMAVWSYVENPENLVEFHREGAAPATAAAPNKSAPQRDTAANRIRRS
jgi:hypothetical protein